MSTLLEIISLAMLCPVREAKKQGTGIELAKLTMPNVSIE